MAKRRGPPVPKVDVEKFAKEVKKFLNVEKMNLVDPGRTAIEAWPKPTDRKYPEMKSFALQWKELFDYADRVTGAKGEGFPHEAAAEFEAKLEAAQDLVNQDAEFWQKLRAEVLPLYGTTKFVKGADGGVEAKNVEADKGWAQRWKKVKVFYDPIDMDVTTKKFMKNKITGEKTFVEVISDRTIPQGFVVKVL